LIDETTERKKWKVSAEEMPPEKFWTDFSNFVKASFNYEQEEEGERHDHYWQTLVHWSEVLMNRYNNKIANMVVMGYLDEQSRRATAKYD